LMPYTLFTLLPIRDELMVQVRFQRIGLACEPWMSLFWSDAQASGVVCRHSCSSDASLDSC